MKSSGNTLLITGGATGIGFALAEALLKKGNEVIVCGRREEKLNEAKRRLPGLRVRKCNVADPRDRKSLLEWTLKNFGRLNVLVNNAGIQREIDFKNASSEPDARDDEIEINLKAPVRLSALFVPHLMKREEAAVVNVSSGLGFVPIAIMPVYCATKAALHSWTLSLRRQLADTSVKVFEIIPPTVDTELDCGARDRRGQKDRGIKSEEVAEAAVLALEKDEFEAAVGQARFLRDESRKDPDRIFRMLNGG
jgi:uncharacterized oxidoreductase